MSKLLLLYGYNNYFNRIMKKKSSIAEYKAEVGEGHYVELNDTNFNVTDGVNARHVFNTSNFLDGKSADYLVREFNGTLERWFVLESVKIMANQVQLSLRRDLVADFYDNIKVAPAFIQKGMLDYDSPLIFNSESLQFNQIKKKEILLKDSTQSPWIVGYMARNFSATGADKITTHAKVPTGYIYDYDELPTAIKNRLGQEVISTSSDEINISIIGFKRTDTEFSWKHAKYNFNLKNNGIISSNYETLGRYRNEGYFITEYGQYSYEEKLQQIKRCIISSNFSSALGDALDIPNISLTMFNTYNNAVYRDDNGVLHTIRFKKINTINANYKLRSSDLLNTTIGLAFNGLGNNIRTYTEFEYNANGTEVAYLSAEVQKYALVSETGVYQDASVEITTSKNECSDAPYDIFAIPAGDIIRINNGESISNIVGESALQIARAIKLKGGSNIYDIQLFPYCPFRECLDIDDNTIVDTTFLTLHQDYELVKDEEDNIINIIVFPQLSKGTFDIELDEDYLKIGEDIIEKKISSETVKARFVSPNYSGSFDINPQKNYGIDTINVDYNLKPISPYIHVSPVFKGLYGDDYNDARGLICGGDFSISLANDMWEEYQIQNKNYENIFNRQIENMDVNNSLAMEKAKYTAVIGSLTGGISSGVGGALTGAKAGPYGAIAGAAVGLTVGTGLSIAGAAEDISLLSRQQSENRDYAVDMYTYNLQNIQALPYTLSKVSTINENNKIFPFIEIYDCTDVEKENLRNKIKYNGMTVMVQGKIEDFVKNEGDYVQAQLIRLEGLNEDNHAVTEIYNELMKGVYIYG